MKYFRMTQDNFFELLHMIKSLIEKHTTKFREAICPRREISYMLQCRTRRAALQKGHSGIESGIFLTALRRIASPT
nr:unnamed protein product [Callosobruchus analis]